MDILIAALHGAAANKLLMMMVSMATATLVFVLIGPRGAWLWSLAAVALLAMANLLFGHRLVGALLMRYGAAGAGTVVAVEDTGSHDNGRAARRIHTLLRDGDGRTVESSYHSSDLVAYPPLRQGTPLPQPGVEFSVRLLPSNPRVFAIVTDDGSAYARALHCLELAGAMNASRRRHDFAQDSANYRRAYSDARAAYEAAGCAAIAGRDGRDTALDITRGITGSPRQADTAR